jgi:hypothetical protein
MRVARSVNGIPIRLTDERWLHVTEEHSELAGYFFDVIETIETPESVVEGAAGELLAFREMEPGKYLVVVYRETAPNDGFVITAFLTRQIRRLEQRRRIWPN